VKNLKTSHAIILGCIIIALSIIYYTANDPLSKCMNKIMEHDDIHPGLAAQACTGKE
tara:strand:- start:229 stop:399 length:171 start_codon:yes stop_codon:yes gene_type:complete